MLEEETTDFVVYIGASKWNESMMILILFAWWLIQGGTKFTFKQGVACALVQNPAERIESRL